MDGILKALQATLHDQDTIDRITAEAKSIAERSPQLDPYDIVKQAVENLSVEGKISSAEADRISLNIEVAQLSNNNAELMEAVDKAQSVRDVKEFSSGFDDKAIADAAGAGVPEAAKSDEPNADASNAAQS